MSGRIFGHGPARRAQAAGQAQGFDWNEAAKGGFGGGGQRIGYV